jgi:hypothetical protein
MFDLFRGGPFNSFISSEFLELLSQSLKPGNTNLRGGLSTVDLLIKVACFVKK